MKSIKTVLSSILGVPFVGEVLLPWLVVLALGTGIPAIVAIREMQAEIETARINGSKPCPPPVLPSSDELTPAAHPEIAHAVR